MIELVAGIVPSVEMLPVVALMVAFGLAASVPTWKSASADNRASNSKQFDVSSHLNFLFVSVPRSTSIKTASASSPLPVLSELALMRGLALSYLRLRIPPIVVCIETARVFEIVVASPRVIFSDPLVVSTLM